ncbi:phage tail protein [Chitinophaga sp. Cy-1792]|uniref:phage tail protein n=1 Tax=Chitinophaga sp. Cy-1792 TaxID=2608339 RepID=UPI00141E3B32|nr:tail fiber protein [Chitinophaga sp. Cy-1792]NIG54505.1 phage tail protein [Chitinophaga sp. Cy-1792]
MSFEPYLGEIMMVGYNPGYVPVGWLPCDGQIVSIQQYPALFSLLGISYGGDGKTNFALPNLMDATVIGQGQGLGLTERLLGDKGGSLTTTLTIDNLPYHTHTFSAKAMSLPVGDVATTASPANAYFGSIATGNAYGAPVGGIGGMDLVNNMALENTGSSQVMVNNVQPSLGTFFLIAIVGDFPTSL